jgi:release factor glutamine methyltransferase
MRLSDWVAAAKSYLPDLENPDITMMRLLHALIKPESLDSSRLWYYKNLEQEVSQEAESALLQWIQRAKKGEPLDYILGSCHFFNHRWLVTPDVLIPRSDTELLVLVAEAYIQSKNHELSIVELGVGSGAVILSLADLFKKQHQWLGTDICAKALAVAQANAKQLTNSQVQWHQGSWFDGLQRQFDVIISNPPYIAKGDLWLEESVQQYEPALALFSEQEGFADLGQLIQIAPRFLNHQGFLVLEHGFMQADGVRDRLEEVGFYDIFTHHDLGGRPRVTSACWAGRSVC